MFIDWIINSFFDNYWAYWFGGALVYGLILLFKKLAKYNWVDDNTYEWVLPIWLFGGSLLGYILTEYGYIIISN